MLARFSVKNFKSFNQEIVFDLENAKGYAFNRQSVINGVINNALVYGCNGVGKSNLGLAIFDIISHLTDKERNKDLYIAYVNASNELETATFHYEFIFGNNRVVYEYEKESYEKIVMERFFIDGKELAYIDRRKSNEAIISFRGAETLKNSLTNEDLSLLKYVKNNTELEEGAENECFKAFFQFVEGMLFFRSLQDNMYLGFQNAAQDILSDIIDRRNVPDFEVFLNKAGIECKLSIVEILGKAELVFDFDGNKIPFWVVASQGTRSLTLFYYWLQRLRSSNVSFLFIDEFDAFYHHTLSALVVNELKDIGIQFVLTTHNTSIISNEMLRPDCYFLMTKDSISSLAESTSKELREAHNIEKMYKAGVFNGL